MQKQAKIEAEFSSNTRNYPYRETVGSILYLAYKTRPDLSFAVGYASRYMETPTEEKIKNIKQIFRYLNGFIDQGIKYLSEAEEDLIETYSDSDFAGDPESRQSTTGYVIFFGGGLCEIAP
jgi:hypothetical protein